MSRLDCIKEVINKEAYYSALDPMKDLDKFPYFYTEIENHSCLFNGGDIVNQFIIEGEKITDVSVCVIHQEMFNFSFEPTNKVTINVKPINLLSKKHKFDTTIHVAWETVGKIYAKYIVLPNNLRIQLLHMDVIL